MTTPLLVVDTAFSFAAVVLPTDEVPKPVVAPHREKEHPSLCYEVLPGDRLYAAQRFGMYRTCHIWDKVGDCSVQ
jgi:hypothetical protein